MNKNIEHVSPRSLHPLGLLALGLGALLLLLAGNQADATVSNIPDGDVEALVAALDEAEEGDVINLAQDGTYTLTEINNVRNGANGLPVISLEITIQGNGATIQRDSAAPPFRIFYFDEVGPQATLSNVVIKRGETIGLLPGGGIYAENSSPEIVDCTFENNGAEMGGGLFNDGGSPLITNCTFRNNFAGFDEGGAGMANVNNASPTITDSVFEGNHVATLGGGILNINSSPEITRCVFEDNLAERGGGIASINNSHPVITDCLFIDNQGDEDGGAMYNVSSSPTLISCLFDGNLALMAHGGAMLNLVGSSPIVMECSFRDNVAGEGGGGIANFGNSNPEITNSVFEDHRAITGGGILNLNSSPLITNSVFEGNTASGPDSVFEFGENGGGIANFNNSNPVIIDSTFRFNSAEEAGGGIFNSSNSSSEISSSFFCENDPDHIAGPWQDLGSNQFSDTCEPVDPKELLADLIVTVEGMSLNRGIRNSLIAQLSAALRSLEHPRNQKAAPQILTAFIQSVSARSGRQIPANDAESLIDAAGTILGLLEEP